jgi:hypothetical protein
MGYKTLVDSNITMAFNLLKDLAEDGVLHKSSNVDFDFSTGDKAADSGEESLPIKVVVVEDDKKSSKHNSIKRQVLFKTRNLGDVNSYESLTFSDSVDAHLNGTWRFGPKLNNDGYTILAEIFREI